MGKKLTTEEVKERIYSAEGDNYKLLSEYVNAKTKIKVKHVACGYEYEVNWSNFKQGQRCPKCAMLARKNKLAFTNEDIVKAIYKLVGDEYTKMDGNYINNQTKFKMRHNICGFEYEIAWNTFKQGCRCPKCSGLMKLTNEDIVKRMHDLVGNEYTKLDNNYINSGTRFKIKHNFCGHEYMVCWDHFKQGKRCPKCAGCYIYTDSEISELISEMTNGEYIKQSEYKNSQTKFKIKHSLCGHEYEVKWNNFQQGQRCPKCNQPKGEKFIQDYLTNQGISFATQVRFSDCRYKNPLPFDFGVIDSEKRVKALIEFDGEQHYKSVDFFGGEEALQQTQIRDSIKDSFCKKNKIPLLRIRFDEDIEQKLSLFLTQERVKV